MNQIRSTEKSSGKRTETAKLAIWTFAWVATMAVATFGPVELWESQRAITVLAIIVNLAVGAGMILANRRYLRTQDELQQKIQFDAMAIALGVGVVGGLGYSLLDITDVIAADAEIGHLVMLISIAYLASIVVGRVRYR